MKAAIYTRVSSEEQIDGYSLQAQEDACRQLCKLRGWTVVAAYEEPGRSGKTVYRPAFQQMLRDAENGVFDVLVVHKLDRFSRSLLDVLTYLNRLHLFNVSFVSVTEQFDFSTPFGKLVLAVLGAFAEWYVNNLAAEVRKGKKARAKAGDWNGTLSFGYTTLRRLRKELIALGERFKGGEIEQDEYSRLAEAFEDALESYAHVHDTAAIPHPVNAEAVRLAYEWYATGRYSDNDIAWRLNERGYRTTGNWGSNPFGKDTITWLLQNKFYIGETSYQGKERGADREWMPGNHEPLVSRELFERCQEVRRMRARVAQNSSRSRDVAAYPLTPLLVCLECGSHWRGQNLRGTRRYRDPARQLGRECLASPKSAKAEHLEAQAENIMWAFRLALPDDWRERALRKLANEGEEARQRREIEHQRQVLEARLERARRLFVIGDISETEYLRLRVEIQAQIDCLPAFTPVRGTALDMERAAALLDNLEELWEYATLEERGDIFRALFKTLYVDGGDIVAVEPTALLWELQNFCIINESATIPGSASPDICVTSSGSDGIRVRWGYQVILLVRPGTMRSRVMKLVA